MNGVQRIAHLWENVYILYVTELISDLSILLKSIVLVAPKIFTIVKETFTPIPEKFMISVTA
jgi:hypothetical protein